MGITLILLSGLCYVSRQRSEAIRAQAVENNNVKANQLKAEIDRRIAMGAAEAEVVAFLRARHPNHISFLAGRRNEYFVPVGSEPSNVWYCGSIQAGVMLRCEGGRLINTEIARWSNDCL